MATAYATFVALLNRRRPAGCWESGDCGADAEGCAEGSWGVAVLSSLLFVIMRTAWCCDWERQNPPRGSTGSGAHREARAACPAHVVGGRVPHVPSNDIRPTRATGAREQQEGARRRAKTLMEPRP
ncbi:hypothetical protein GCM10018777_66030 [Streptomyces albogriseolus]|nr:hypothetical protein GCM10018777_66030 [Streptomyces viridodiastaticus]